MKKNAKENTDNLFIRALGQGDVRVGCGRSAPAGSRGPMLGARGEGRREAAVVGL